MAKFRPGKWLKRSATVVMALLIFSTGLLCFSPEILEVDGGAVPAQTLIVLGGGGQDRLDRAAGLFREGRASSIIVSGAGDCDENRNGLIWPRQVLRAYHVIETEKASHTTKQNAEFTVRLLRARGIKSAIIVTSWYHSRRALACFQKFGQGIQFYSAPAGRTSVSFWPDKNEIRLAYHEYPKLAWYWVRYRVDPL